MGGRDVSIRGRSAAEAAGFSSETNLHRAIRVQENIGDVLAKRPYRSHAIQRHHWQRSEAQNDSLVRFVLFHAYSPIIFKPKNRNGSEQE